MLKASDILNRAGAARGFRRAFTLLEVLIAVAALSLIAVGVAKIFDATGKTIAAGRRVSAFNAYASLIEQQLRTDISAMTRRGFLVIRHEYADRSGDGTITMPLAGQNSSTDAVPLHIDDERARMRRIDELMFFAEGDFASVRPALHPAYVARSDAARIYYGHGQRARVPAAFDPNDVYYKPELNGTVWQPSPGTYDDKARLGFNDPTNPNQYASDWILLRHVTLLCPPRTAGLVPAVRPFTPQLTDPQMQDSPLQVSLQPAASNIFRGLAAFFPSTRPPASVRSAWPAFTSGLVDIAATDLSTIRSIVTSANVHPNQVSGNFFDPFTNSNGPELGHPGVDGMITLPDALNVLDRSQSWMNDAFPSDAQNPTPAQRTRMRCELTPRNFIGANLPQPANPYQPTSAEAAYRRADQVMLSASNFLPRCTEFIVEWSFGKTYPSDSTSVVPPYVASKAGQFVWHGMARRVGNDLVADVYTEADVLKATSVPFARNDGSGGQHPVRRRVIHGTDVLTPLPPAGETLISHFGYFDPTFDLDVYPPPSGNGVVGEPQDSASPTVPWAWPKLIRVTLSLADPTDPTIERTFQFVFQVPDGV